VRTKLDIYFFLFPNDWWNPFVRVFYMMRHTFVPYVWRLPHW